MAALTRERCDPKLCIPTELHVEYYTQRAAAGMILS
jgi:2,4-dienoyl-CoA reductase-like NADH-dependent reductase (Old Yellow Enzyme family)